MLSWFSHVRWLMLRRIGSSLAVPACYCELLLLLLLLLFFLVAPNNDLRTCLSGPLSIEQSAE